jgi:3-dehydro-L-gulonate 2-dehydrogenase
MKPDDQTVRIPAGHMKNVFSGILKRTGFSDSKADACAGIFTLNSLEGVYSHGVNRFPRFIRNVRDGYVIPEAEPALVHSAGALEQWDGNLGPGPLNASFATMRAAELAEKNGIGLVALANTNHWMRGGTYGWQAARKGFIFIGWTNTEANMPAWGAADARVGNNPFVIAVPYNGEAIVLDFAMTQFSYGKMETYKREGKKLPFPGGFNSEGKLTDDPGEILLTRRALPIGNWKGSGFSLLLDILATVISGGLSTHEITKSSVEYSISQVFILISPKRLHNHSSVGDAVQKIIDDLKSSTPENKETKIRYPGENVVKIRNENLKSGIPVSRDVWREIETL